MMPVAGFILAQFAESRPRDRRGQTTRNESVEPESSFSPLPDRTSSLWVIVHELRATRQLRSFYSERSIS